MFPAVPLGAGQNRGELFAVSTKSFLIRACHIYAGTVWAGNSLSYLRRAHSITGKIGGGSSDFYCIVMHQNVRFLVKILNFYLLKHAWRYKSSDINSYWILKLILHEFFAKIFSAVNALSTWGNRPVQGFKYGAIAQFRHIITGWRSVDSSHYIEPDIFVFVIHIGLL